jgi:hypothetical protein
VNVMVMGAGRRQSLGLGEDVCEGG